MQTATWIILILVVLLVLFPLLVIPLIVYRVLLVRTKPEKWGRACSMPEDPGCVRMYEEGAAWAEKNRTFRTEVHIVSDGLNLYGEYYDFGYRKAAVIIPGRMETGVYSCYFAEPFRRAGCNVLVFDSRAHGLSEGKYNCVGFREYKDVLKWCRLLHDTFGNEEIILHGICIGSSTALFALADETVPEYVRAMIGEGMYINFYESLKNHMIVQKRPLYPFIFVIVLWIRIFSKASVMSDGPLKRIAHLKKPILFLHSREDVYSVPENAEKLYDACPSEKEMIWFETGEHSRLRVTHREQYDAAVERFVSRVL